MFIKKISDVMFVLLKYFYLEHVVDINRQGKAYVVITGAKGGRGHNGAYRRGALQRALVDGAQQVFFIQRCKTQSS